MEKLRRWLDDPRELSVRVLVGAGGRGKTRLALELGRAASQGEWLAGFASAEELDGFRRQNGIEQWRWDKPVLVVVDYAASRVEQIRDWLRELVDASLEDRPKLRLLLLERQANALGAKVLARRGLGLGDGCGELTHGGWQGFPNWRFSDSMGECRRRRTSTRFRRPSSRAWWWSFWRRERNFGGRLGRCVTRSLG